MSINNKYQPLYVASDSTITSVENASSNLQFCEVNNSINTISTPTLINQNTNEDLNLSAYNGNSINPIIQINNTHQHVNITSNLNVIQNINVANNLDVQNINVANNIILSGNVSASANTDTVSTFGKAKIGHIGYANVAGFAHFDNDDGQSYALLQNADGHTYLK